MKEHPTSQRSYRSMQVVFVHGVLLVAVASFSSAANARHSEVDLQRALRQLTERANRQFVVVQVGAHVGFTENDPVHSLATEYGWKGVLLEPVPDLYQQLVANYGSRGKKASKLSLENAALAEYTGKASFYQRQNADYSRTAELHGAGLRTQMGSLRRQFGKKGRRIWVNTTTLHDVLDKHNLTYVDYLQIDAEGMDATVLRQVPFPSLMPQVIQYERKHLLPLEKEESLQLLNANNYTVFQGGAPDYDVTAFSSYAWIVVKERI